MGSLYKIGFYTDTDVDRSTLVFTTKTLITPDTFPFPDCHGLECHGQLV